MAFLVQVKQSNKCGSVRNDEIINFYTWDLVRALESASPASCKTPATFIDSIKLDPIRSSPTCKKSDQIFESYVLQHIKTNFSKTNTSTNAHDWGYKWGRHTQI